MLKKFKSKDFIAGMIFTLILVSCINVVASGVVREKIEVLYNDIKLVVDGKPVAFGKDAAGKQIEPFIYNGTTYLPVRAVGEALGKRVDWDGESKTVYIGEKPGEITYMTEVIKPYYSSGTEFYRLNNPYKLSFGGKEFKTGYELGSRHFGGSLIFNLDAQFNEIEGTVGHRGNGLRYLNIYLDGELYESYKLDNDSMPEKITIPVKGVMQLKIESPSPGWSNDGRACLGDLIIK